MASQSPPDEEVLRKFYRSFHKHGPSNWAKIAKDTKMPPEQCEMLHKQHMSFLSLRANQALEAAFVALVNDHYNATLNRHEDEHDDEPGPSGRANGRGLAEEEQDAHVASSSSQKPKRTPKPTPQRLAAEEEAAARRLARSNQGTPKSARAFQRGPPSPSAGDWPSSQRKRNRRLFEDMGDMDIPRYRSPTSDRWRGRQTTDVDEGVDALLSLASGGHPSANMDDRPSVREATNTAEDLDGDADFPEPGPLHGTPKRARGVRGVRSTPTPSGTPARHGARASAAAAAADAFPVPGVTGLRSPRSRVGTAAAAAAAAGGSGRGGSAAAGRSRKEQPASPSTSSQQEDGGDDASAAAAADTSDAAAGAPSPSDGVAGAAATEPAGERLDAADAGPSSPGPVNAAGRPIRKRKPSAIAIAAAASVEEDESGARSARGEIAAMAAALGAVNVFHAEALVPAPAPDIAAGPTADGGSGGGAVVDVATSSLLAGVPPVKTRPISRANSTAPGSRRAADRPSPHVSFAPSVTEAAAPAPEAEPEAVAMDAVPEPPPAPEESTAEAGPSSEMAAAAVAVEPIPEPQPAPAPTTKPRSMQPPPGRTRRRKSLPERLPPMWEPLQVPPRAAGNADGRSAATAGLDAAASAEGAAGAPGPSTAPQDGEAAAVPFGTSTGQAESGQAGARPMPALEVALRHCLGPRVRRWCLYEFMYSAIDRPWFSRNELLEFCLHLSLPTHKLTRLEWSVLRGALGRPRRLSLAFLREERIRLEGYREHARLKYEEVAHGFEVPPELPRQLRVGQEVVARHPGSQQLHDGVILTVKGNKYRVQFNRSELMTEVIRDTDLMPLDPHECMPPNVVVHPMLLNGRPYDPVRIAEQRGLAPTVPTLRTQILPPRPLGSWQTGLDTQMMREEDNELVAEVQRTLNVKADLVAHLTQLNSEAAAGRHSAGDSGARSEHFQLQYSNVVLQLKETNAVLEAAVSRLTSRQQQIMGGSGAPAITAILALQQQQQAAVAGLLPGLGIRPALPAPSPQPLQPPQMPPMPGMLTPPVPVPAPSPTPPIPVVPAGQPQSLGKAPGAMSLPNQPPVVVPPPRPGTAPSPSMPAPPVQPLGPPLSVPGAGSRQLVEQALEEARAVVDLCRGKDVEPLPAQQLLQVSGPAAVQMPNGESAPLVLPPGVTPHQQLSAAAPDSQQAGFANGAAAGSAGPLSEAAANGHGGVGQGAVANATEPAAPAAQAKAEDGAPGELSSAAAAAAVRAIAELQALSDAPGPSGRPLTEEELSEHLLRNVIVGCVGVLFTIQKCTIGNVPAATVAEALDLAVQQLQINTGGENDGLYRDIVQSVQGLKGYLTRALA